MNDYHAVSCDSERGSCANPYFDIFEQCTIDHEEICSKKVLLSGEVLGQLPPWYVRYYTPTVFILFLLAFVFNHFKNNRGFKWKKSN